MTDAPVSRPPDADALPELLRLAARGETAAFARVVRIRHEPLTRIALVVTCDPRLAAAAVDEAWLTAWQELQGRPVPADPEAWLARLAADEARSVVEHGATRDRIDPPGPGDAGAAAPAPAPGTVLAALLAMSPADRRLVALHHAVGAADVGTPGRMLAPLAPLARRRARLARARVARLLARVDASRLRAWAAVPRVAPVNADATARRAADERRLEQGRRMSVAVSAVAGLLVVGAPYLVPLLAGR